MEKTGRTTTPNDGYKVVGTRWRREFLPPLSAYLLYDDNPMTISLPPPQAPQPGDVAALRTAAAGQRTFRYQAWHVHVSGNDRVPEDELERIFHSAANVSEAVRAIPTLYYRAGWPLTRVLYAASGADLYIQIVVAGIDRVQASPVLLPYLGPLAGHGTLTDKRLERRRLLAAPAAERAGITSALRIENDGTDAQPVWTLVAEDSGPPHPTLHGQVDFGNVGNRYVGRDLADASVTATTPWGDKLDIGAITSVQGFGIGDPGALYREGNGAWSRDTPFGFFGLDGRYARFRQTAAGFRLRGSIRQIGVSWLMPVYADFTKRVVFQFHVHDNRFATALADFPQLGDVARESYVSVESGLNYEQSLSDRWKLAGSLLVDHGFGPRQAAQSPARLDYWAWKPSLQLVWSNLPWTTALTLTGQYSADTVPQLEQWVLGGLDRLSAWRSGVATGDRGAYVTASVTYRLDPTGWLRLTPSAFVEQGWSASRKSPATPDTPTTALTDVGAAVGMALGDHAIATVSAAVPVATHGIDSRLRGSDRAGWFFRLTGKF